MSLIQLHEVSFAYPGGRAVLEGIDLEIKKGDFVILLGPNGGGKTTLLKLMAGLIQPSYGSILIYGQKPGMHNQKIGYLPQLNAHNPQFPITVFDTVLLGWCGGDKRKFWLKPEQKEQAWQALEQVGMLDAAKQRIGSLSGGQRQRVMIARALIGEPEILLLDEPSSGIDPQSKGRFYELLEAISQKATIVMVSHDLGVIPQAVKSVACVNRHLHYHPAPQITEQMLMEVYGCREDGTCPVELVAHGVPHRVLAQPKEFKERHD